MTPTPIRSFGPVITLLSLLFWGPTTSAQNPVPTLVNLSGPVSSEIREVENAGDAGYLAVGDREIYRSTDEGKTWTREPSPGGNLLEIEMEENGSMWVATDSGVYRRATGDDRWKHISNEIVHSIDVSAQGTFHGIQEGTELVLFTRDNGATWTKRPNFTRSRKLTPGYDGSLWLMRDSIVMRSTDDGFSWFPHGVTPNNDHPLDIIPLHSGSLLMITATSTYLCRPPDTAWSRVGAAPDSGLIVSSVASAGDVVATIYHHSTAQPAEIRISKDSGMSWRSIRFDTTGTTEDIPFAFTSIASSDSTGFLAGSSINGTRHGGVISRIVAPYQRWENLLTTQLSYSYLQRIMMSPAGVLFAQPLLPTRRPTSLSDVLMRSRDSGRTWSAAFTSDNTEHLKFTSMISDGTLFVCDNDSVMYRSTDEGESWSAVTVRDPIADTLTTNWFPRGPVLEIDQGYLLVHSGCCADNYDVYVSTDNGVSWEFLAVGAPRLNRIEYVTTGPDGTIYLGANELVFVSSDSGRTWIERDFISSGINLVLGIGVNTEGNPVVIDLTRKLYRSDNRGADWKIVDVGFLRFISLNSDRQGWLYGESSNGVTAEIVRSRDNGDTWEQLYDLKGTGIIVRSITAVNDDLIFVGTQDNGIWKLELRPDPASGVHWELSRPDILLDLQ